MFDKLAQNVNGLHHRSSSWPWLRYPLALHSAFNIISHWPFRCSSPHAVHCAPTVLMATILLVISVWTWLKLPVHAARDISLGGWMRVWRAANGWISALSLRYYQHTNDPVPNDDEWRGKINSIFKINPNAMIHSFKTVENSCTIYVWNVLSECHSNRFAILFHLVAAHFVSSKVQIQRTFASNMYAMPSLLPPTPTLYYVNKYKINAYTALHKTQ